MDNGIFAASIDWYIRIATDHCELLEQWCWEKLFQPVKWPMDRLSQVSGRTRLKWLFWSRSYHGPLVASVVHAIFAFKDGIFDAILEYLAETYVLCLKIDTFFSDCASINPVIPEIVSQNMFDMSGLEYSYLHQWSAHGVLGLMFGLPWLEWSVSTRFDGALVFSILLQ
jgi:hypothetical protein